MLSVPRALTSKSVVGSTSDVVTATCPARWRTASWSFTCSVRAPAFLTSSLMNVIRFGYLVMTHLRLRSVPGRLRLSSRLTCQPSLIRWTAALTPRKPAPPVIRTLRSGSAGSGGVDLVLVSRSEGSTAAHTLAGGYAPQECDRHDPRGTREDQGFAPGVALMGVDVRAREKQGRDRAVHHVQQSGARIAAREQGRQAEQALHRRDGGHDQVSRAKAAADALVPKIVIGAPQSEQHRKRDEHTRAVAVKKRERLHRLGVKSGDLPAEVVDGQAQSLLELDPRLPAELFSCAPVVKGDAVHIAFARRSEHGLEPVLRQQPDLAEQVIDRHRDARADVEGAAVTPLEGGEVCHRDVADVQHVARLVPVAVDRDRLALDHPAREDGHDAALPGEEVLPRTVDVGVAKSRVAQAKRPVEHSQVMLERELAGAVWREWAKWMVFIRRHDVGLAVERATGGAEDHLAHCLVDARAEHVEATDYVDQGVVPWIGHGLRNLGLCRVMVHDVGLERRDRGVHLCAIRDVDPM